MTRNCAVACLTAVAYASDGLTAEHLNVRTFDMLMVRFCVRHYVGAIFSSSAPLSEGVEGKNPRKDPGCIRSFVPRTLTQGKYIVGMQTMSLQSTESRHEIAPCAVAYASDGLNAEHVNVRVNATCCWLQFCVRHYVGAIFPSSASSSAFLSTALNVVLVYPPMHLKVVLTHRHPSLPAHRSP